VGGGKELWDIKPFLVEDKLSDEDRVRAQWLKDSVEYPPTARRAISTSARQEARQGNKRVEREKGKVEREKKVEKGKGREPLDGD
jgi:hypothetical protein